MEVILTQDVAKLGRRGDVVRVKNGYARNFLLPRKLALKATSSNKLHFEEVMRQSRAKVEKQRVSAQEMFAKLNGEHVKLTLAFGETGKAYGSITSKDIASAFREKDIYFDHHQVMLDHPLKEPGSHDVQIRLFADIIASVKVWVVPEEDVSDETAEEVSEVIAEPSDEDFAEPGVKTPAGDEVTVDTEVEEEPTGAEPDEMVTPEEAGEKPGKETKGE